MTDDELTDFLLAGYVPLRMQGLTLPCYASGPQSNAWYCARCSIDGDHSGTITAFEPFEADDIIRLPADAARAVAIGDPWHDVLLWKEHLHVGTPSVIVSQLGDAVAELASEAPLTLLDLAMATGGLDRAALVRTAFAHVRSHWGAEEANRWQSETFARHQVMIEARRLLANAKVSVPSGVVRQIEVSHIGDELSVDIPSGLRRHLKDHRLLDLFAERVRKLAIETGLPLRAATTGGAPDLDAPPIPAIPERGQINGISPLVHDGATKVAVVASGSRARMLQRNLRRPDWTPDWNAATRPSSHSVLLNSIDYGLAGFDIIDPLSSLPDMRRYSAIIWVVDDISFMDEAGRFAREQLQGTFAPGEKPLCILAPILPSQYPSRILADRSLLADFPLFNTILDTSIVRSPFWSGNIRRSIDRRVADLISATAELLSPGSPLHAGLTEDRRGSEPLLLSIATGLLNPDARSELASEISAADPPSREDHGTSRELAWWEVHRSGARAPTRSGAAMVRPHYPQFKDFVEAVVRRNVPSHLGGLNQLSVGDAPPSISKKLRYPHLSAAIEAVRPGGDELYVATAEAPDLQALRAAERVGWNIVRYSDTEGLAALSSMKGSRAPLLPADIALPPLNRLGRNRGLAIRGVDPRDVVRMPVEVLKEWQNRFGNSELVRDVRWYRTSLREDELQKSLNTAAIPAERFMDGAQDWEVMASLISADARVNASGVKSKSKRTSDLRASWSRSADGTSRYMLEDGKLPVRIAPIDSDEIAAQKFFTIDGDASVPLLFSSRAFYVWARSTLTRSPSWSSRFSISRTFETFPLPDLFRVSEEEAGRISIQAVPDTELFTLVNSLGSNIIDWRDLHDISSSPSDLLRQSEGMLLRAIGLSEDASDLDLLERLVEMNRNSGAGVTSNSK